MPQGAEAMRILISVQNYHPAYAFGGRVTKAVALAEGLLQLGHSVLVATTSVVGRNGRPAWRTRVADVNGVTVHYLGTVAAMGTSSLNPSVLPFASSHVPKVDAVHIIGLYESLGPAIGWYAKRSAIPYAVEPIGMLIPIVRSLAAKRLYHHLFGRRLLRDARAIVVTSRIEREDAIRFGVPAERLIMRRNGVDLRQFARGTREGAFRKRIGVPPGEPLILWIGRVEERKNLKQLLLAVKGLAGAPWHLAIVGPAEQRQHLVRLQDLARDLGLAARVHFVDAVFGDEKVEAFRDATVVALVSIRENWGNVVQEAMAAGVPVLVTDTCGVADVVEKGGGLIVRRDVQPIRDGLRRLLTDHDLYHRLKVELRDHPVDLSWEQPVTQMASLFASWKEPGGTARCLDGAGIR